MVRKFNLNLVVGSNCCILYHSAGHKIIMGYECINFCLCLIFGVVPGGLQEVVGKEQKRI